MIRTYTITINNSVLPMTDNTPMFLLSNNDHRYELLSIFWDLRIQSAGQIPLNLNVQTTQGYWLQFMPIGGRPGLIAECFIPSPGAPYVVRNGSEFSLYHPGKQILFGGLFLNNITDLTFYYYNRDALITYEYFFTCIIKTNDLM